MTKNLLGRRLRDALNVEDIPLNKMNDYYTCFAEHARYLAGFYGIDVSQIRPPAQLRLAEEFNEQETKVFCLYSGYDLTQSGTPALW